MSRINRTLREEYFLWLYNQVDGKKRSYRNLCTTLHNKPFQYFIKNDDNRCQDGLDLRQLFIEEQKIDETHLEVVHFLKGECTVFEMMVGLAQRMNDLQSDLRSTDNNASKYFLELIRNLRLDDYNDMLFHNGQWTQVVDNNIEFVLERLMDRTYDYFGIGSLFPMKRRPARNMAEVEIWYQLMLYLDENDGKL